MITILKEITDWNCSNHTYHVNGQKQLVGFQPINGEYKEFITPMKQWSQTRRKFKIIGTREEVNTNAQETWEFTGSKGNTYVVSSVDDILYCTCAGFNFRKDCKHVKEVAAI